METESTQKPGWEDLKQWLSEQQNGAQAQLPVLSAAGPTPRRDGAALAGPTPRRDGAALAGPTPRRDSTVPAVLG